jgi:hypothetical protein
MMIIFIALIIVVVIILAGGALYYIQRYNTMQPVGPSALNINNPPGGNIRVQNPDKITVLPGQKWPSPASAGCGSVWPNYPNGLITSYCDVGTHPNLIQGGALKCGNTDYNSFAGCSQATAPY